MTNAARITDYAKNAPSVRRPNWIVPASHWFEARRRRVRRNRYLSVVGTRPRRYQWFESLMQAMCAR
jgi:hypothetical protein